MSDRESEVLRLIASGYSNKEIAGAPGAQRQDRRGSQGQRDAEAGTDAGASTSSNTRCSRDGCRIRKLITVFAGARRLGSSLPSPPLFLIFAGRAGSYICRYRRRDPGRNPWRTR